MRTLLFVLLCCVYHAKSANILGVFPAVSHSHFTIGFRLIKELADRGHNVTLVSPYLQKNPIKNLREIQLTGFLEEAERMSKDVNMYDFGKIPAILNIALIGHFGYIFVDKVLGHETVHNLLQSNETYDVVIMEQFLSDALQIFAHHFKAPSVLMSTVGSSIWTNRQVGNPSPASYIPHMFLNYPANMNFCQRTYNTLMTVAHELYDHLYFLPMQNKALHQHVADAPDIYDMIYNTSLILLNSHISTNQPVPHVPNMIEIGGFHVQKPKELPNDLENILDSAAEGLAFFSMGSNLKSKNLPAEKLDVFLKAFSQLKMKVLWKWEDDNLPGQPPNVIIRKWFPQTDVLAHPNVKFFITQGGILSTTEAISFGVPVIGIPVYGDQHMNMAAAVNHGYGISIPYTELSEDRLTSALKEITGNSKYVENARNRAKIINDQPIKPLDNAVYWVEYVIRHKGAPHLRTAALYLKWYQYMLFDVIMFLTTLSVIVLSLFYIIIRKLLRKKKTPKQKVN